jgi:hypothetical protein
MVLKYDTPVEDDKVQLKVYIKRGTSDRFKRMIGLKYQRAERGLLSYEVEEALNSWLAMVGTQTQSTQTGLSTTRTNPIPVIHNLKEAIKDYLMNTGRYENEPQFVPQKFLVEALSAIKGTDIRTIKKWTKLMQQYGCIKQVGVSQWELT